MKVIARGNSSQARDSDELPVVVEVKMTRKEAEEGSWNTARFEEATKEVLGDHLKHGGRYLRNVETGRG